ncbi:unnamed protein product, partial [Mesorhabditis belari]|uniref:SCP2 domain-containing protein n=1 Tax=Mesorhabditis belari TaxID=2138241 RepID=A0AAF3FFR3_9BILA
MPDVELESQFLLNQMIENLPKNQALVKKINAVMLMNFEKDGKLAKQYTFDFRVKSPSIHEGDDGNANVTINTDDADFVKLCFGQLDTAKAFMTRRIRITGNMALLQRIQAVLKSVQNNSAKEKSKL